MKKVIVTGANGFLGSNLCRKLVERNLDVSVLVRRSSDVSEIEGLNLKYLYGDVTDAASLKVAFTGMEEVYHLAGLISYKKYDREKMQLVNVRGTENVIAACTECGVKKLLHLSSVVTVGASFKPVVLDESAAYDVGSLDLGYFETKREAEHKVIAAAQAGRLFAVCANPSTIYGAGDAKKGSRKNQVKVAQGRLGFYTSGGVNVISVDDATDGIILALEKGQSGERYILANENISIKKLFEMIAASSGAAVPKRHLPSFILHFLGIIGDLTKTGLSRENAYTASMYHWFDSQKARRELGFQPKKTAREAIGDSVRWMKDNGILS